MSPRRSVSAHARMIRSCSGSTFPYGFGDGAGSAARCAGVPGVLSELRSPLPPHAANPTASAAAAPPSRRDALGMPWIIPPDNGSGLCRCPPMRHTLCMRATRTHGKFLAAEVGEMAGVSGTTIGQWARRGYIRSSASDGDPRVYSVEDVAEAALVRALLDRGVRHADVRRAIERLTGEYGAWPLSEAPLGTAVERGRTRVVLRERDGIYALAPRGWQLIVTPPAVEEVRLRLNRRAQVSNGRASSARA